MGKWDHPDDDLKIRPTFKIRNGLRKRIRLIEGQQINPPVDHEQTSTEAQLNNYANRDRERE